jgi:hypothetical protein
MAEELISFFAAIGITAVVMIVVAIAYYLEKYRDG